jgi:hypothetical protein
MKIGKTLSDLLMDACAGKNRIILILKNGNGWCEGIVEKIYENKIVKFVSQGRTYPITGFLLVSDILDVID